jgi:phage portal protein BeeE
MGFAEALADAQGASAMAETSIRTMVKRRGSSQFADMIAGPNSATMIGQSFGRAQRSAELYGLVKNWVFSCSYVTAKRCAGQAWMAGHYEEPQQQRSPRRLTDKQAARWLQQKALVPKGLRKPGAKAVYSTDDIEPDYEHPVLWLLDKPNNHQGKVELIEMIVLNLLITGEWYWVGGVVGEGEKQKAELWAVPSAWIQPDHTNGLFRGYILQTGTGQGVRLKPENVARGYFPDPSDIRGCMSPLVACSQSARIDSYILNSQEASFERGINPNVLVQVGRYIGPDGKPQQTPPRLTGSQRRQIIRAVRHIWNQTVSQGDPAILDGLIEDVKKLQMTPQEMDWQNSGQTVKARIMQAFGVNAIILGEVTPANKAQAVVAEENFVKNVVNPILTSISCAASEFFTPFYEDGESLAVWLEQAVARDDEMEFRKFTEARKLGDIEQDEYRAYIGLPAAEPKEPERSPIFNNPQVLAQIAALAAQVSAGAMTHDNAVQALVVALQISKKDADKMMPDDPPEPPPGMALPGAAPIGLPVPPAAEGGEPGKPKPKPAVKPPKEPDDDDAAAKSRLKYSPDQPRDELGRWGSGGGTTSPTELNNWDEAIKWQTEVPSDVADGVRAYQGFRAERLNDELRNDKPLSAASQKIDDALTYCLDNGHFKVENATVYRGEAGHRQYNVGETVEFKEWVSTSLDPSVAERFANTGGSGGIVGGTPTVVTIEAPKGLLVGGSESEVILPKSSSFVVASNTDGQVRLKPLPEKASGDDAEKSLAAEFMFLLGTKSASTKIARALVKAAHQAQHRRMEQRMQRAMVPFFKKSVAKILHGIGTGWTPDPEHAEKQAAKLIAKAFDQEAQDRLLADAAGQPLADGFIAGAQAERILVSATMRRRGYNPDQPRDERGRFGSTGGSSASDSQVGSLYEPSRLAALQTHDGKRASEMNSDEYIEAIGGRSETADESVAYDETLAASYRSTSDAGTFVGKDGAEYEIRIGMKPQMQEGIYAFSRESLASADPEDRDYVNAVGYLRIERSQTNLAVADDHAGNGLGVELSYRMRRVAPFQPSGGLSDSGVAVNRRVHKMLVAEGKAASIETKSTATDALGDFDDDDLDDIDIPTEYPEWLREEAQDFILRTFREPYWQRINQTTRDDIMGTLWRAIEDGLSIRDIATRIMEQHGAQYSRARATMVARTEVSGAMNCGHTEAIRRAYEDIPGIEAAKEWLSIHGATTRDEHAEADGQQVPVDDMFTVGGEQCMYPGDASLSAAMRINCQCLPAGSEITATGLQVIAATKMLYNGPLVEIETRSGRVGKATPNHPVLTTKGWGRYGELKCGDYVIACEVRNESGLRAVQHEQHKPARIEDVFKSLESAAKLRKMASRLPFQFHGDAQHGHGKVHVVIADWMLPNPSGYDAVEDRQECGLVGAARQVGGTQRGVNIAAVRPAKTLGLRVRAEEAETLEAPVDHRPRHVESFGQCDLSHAAEVEAGDFRFVHRDSPAAGATDHVMPLRANLDASELEAALDGVCRDAILFSDSDNGRTLVVFADEVLVRRERIVEGHGHVYDLQSQGGWYASDGIIVHNCTIISAFVGEGLEDDEKIEEAGYNPDQPRVPAGSPEGGQFGSGGGGGASDAGTPASEGATPAQPSGAGERSEPLKLTSSKKIGEWAQQHFPAGSKFDAEEIAGLDKYSGSGFARINNGLRRNEGNLEKVEQVKAVLAIDRALQKGSVPEDTMVYRGIKNRDLVDKLNVGDEFSDHGFVSTSLHRKVGEKFGKEAVLEIKVPKGARALAFDAIWRGGNAEHELLLPRGSKFKVTGVRRLKGELEHLGGKKGKVIVSMELVTS